MKCGCAWATMRNERVCVFAGIVVRGHACSCINL